MNIIEVVPISRGIGTDVLSYFTSKEVPVGAIVDIPLRSKTIQGLVMNVRSVEDVKSEIKNAPYALRKVEKLKVTEFLPRAFMKAAEETALYYAGSLPSVLDTLLPDYLLKNAPKLKTPVEPTPQPGGFEIMAVQGDDDERFGTWKSLIRQEFARKSSVLMVMPTIEDAIHAFSLIEKGIEGYAYLLHGSLPPKTLISTWNTIMTNEHPV